MNNLKKLLSIAIAAAMLSSAIPVFAADDARETGSSENMVTGNENTSSSGSGSSSGSSGSSPSDGEDKQEGDGGENGGESVPEEKEITVSLRFQMYGEHASEPIEYTFNTADRTSYSEYGFDSAELAETEKDGEITPLHLLAEHYYQTILGGDESLISSVADLDAGIKMDGLFLADYMSSKIPGTTFMYAVNNEIPAVPDSDDQYPIPEYSLEDGDEVVIFEGWSGSWSPTLPIDTYYSYFTNENIDAIIGEDISLKLKSIGYFGLTDGPAEGAQLEAALLTDGEEPVFADIPEAVTDADGNVSVSFDTAGTYLISAYRESEFYLPTGPFAEDISRPLCLITVSDDAVESYLPAPGQFVNLPEYSDPVKALKEKTGDIITLGSFGGNVIYKFAEPIINDNKNIYGVDFVIYGNAFANKDGETPQSAGEPAAVMVSRDGKTWYELAGSEYYDINTRRNVTVTYQNPDTSFAEAKEITWTDSQNGSGTIPVTAEHTQSYFPNPAVYGAYQTGVGSNETYTSESVSFTGTMIASDAVPSFGYADVHAKSETDSYVQNPYDKNHLAYSNGDGFDISWAVDSDGNPVDLNSISYVKIYNPKLHTSETTGEVSPEIASIERAVPEKSPVGTSQGLTSLTVNGTRVDLKEGTFSYTVNAGESDTLEINAVSDSKNIFISNKRTESGKAVTIPTCEKTRIIVQNGGREPVIYNLDIIIVGDPDTNTLPEKVFAIPGDIQAEKVDDSTYELTFPDNIDIAKIGVKPLVSDAKVVFDGEELSSASDWLSPESYNVRDGDSIKFSITSRSGDEKSDYTLLIKVDKEAEGGSSSRQIRVRFELFGDSKHGSSNHKSYSTWVKQESFNVPRGSTVKYVTEKVLLEKKMDFVYENGYFSKIRGLAELDNGKYSGWRYSVNGDDPEVGCADYVLDSNDEITWYFTDDYTEPYGEPDDDNNNSNSNSRPSISTGGGVNRNPSNPPVTNPPVTNPDDNENNKPVFTDVDDNFWAAEYIKSCAANGIIFGKTETTFDPGAPVTRAEFIAMLNRIDGETAEYEGSFEDVSEDDWFYGNVSWALKSGITYGVSDTSFAPSAQITRQEMAVMITRYLNYKNITPEFVNEEKVFTDEDNIADYAKASVSDMQKMGIISGRDTGEFAPSETATRAEASVLLSKLYTLAKN